MAECGSSYCDILEGRGFKASTAGGLVVICVYDMRVRVDKGLAGTREDDVGLKFKGQKVTAKAQFHSAPHSAMDMVQEMTMLRMLLISIVAAECVHPHRMLCSALTVKIMIPYRVLLKRIKSNACQTITCAGSAS